VTYTLNGQVEIDFDGVDADVTWTNTELRDILGFTANLTGTSTYSATNKPRYCWNPTIQISDHPVDRDRVWEINSGTTIHRSKDGTAYAVVGKKTDEAKDLRWDLLPQADVSADSDTDYPCLEMFYEDVAHAGQPIRFIPDRTSYAATTDYVVGFWAGEDNEPLGPFTEYAERWRTNWDGRWNVRFSLVEYDG
jgi:hypothetical protein